MKKAIFWVILTVAGLTAIIGLLAFCHAYSQVAQARVEMILRDYQVMKTCAAIATPLTLILLIDEGIRRIRSRFGF